MLGGSGNSARDDDEDEKQHRTLCARKRQIEVSLHRLLLQQTIFFEFLSLDAISYQYVMVNHLGPLKPLVSGYIPSLN